MFLMFLKIKRATNQESTKELCLLITVCFGDGRVYKRGGRCRHPCPIAALFRPNRVGWCELRRLLLPVGPSQRPQNRHPLSCWLLSRQPEDGVKEIPSFKRKGNLRKILRGVHAVQRHGRCIHRIAANISGLHSGPGGGVTVLQSFPSPISICISPLHLCGSQSIHRWNVARKILKKNA